MSNLQGKRRVPRAAVKHRPRRSVTLESPALSSLPLKVLEIAELGAGIEFPSGIAVPVLNSVVEGAIKVGYSKIKVKFCVLYLRQGVLGLEFVFDEKDGALTRGMLRTIFSAEFEEKKSA